MPKGLEILEQKGGLMIFDKPVELADDDRGMCVLKAASDQLGPNAYPELLNRLDRMASGIVVVAEQGRDAAKFRGSFRINKSPRFYLAVVIGTPPSESGTINTALKLGSRGVVECVAEAESTQNSRPAISHYHVLGSGNGLTLLRVRAETDQEGQMRAHFASIGCPIVGDRSFSAERDDLRRLGLHMGELNFEPPGKYTKVRLRSPAPSEFWTVCGLEAPDHARPPAEAPTERPRTPESKPEETEGWEHVAGWYDELLSERRSDHHDLVVHPGVLRLLDPQPGQRVLDVACGQGELCRLLSSYDTDGDPLSVLGIDLSPTLIQAAIDRSPEGHEFQVADARGLSEDAGEFDAATCVLALMNIDELDATLTAISDRLNEGGRFVAVIMHPAFRVSGASDWDFDDFNRQPTQFRRVSGYLSSRADEIVMNPGAVSKGQPAVTTTTHHRSIGEYVRACGRAGLLIDSIEEWTSKRTSEPGPRALAENTARREIPLFLAIRAVKSATTGQAPDTVDPESEEESTPET